MNFVNNILRYFGFLFCAKQEEFINNKQFELLCLYIERLNYNSWSCLFFAPSLVDFIDLKVYDFADHCENITRLHSPMYERLGDVQSSSELGVVRIR